MRFVNAQGFGGGDQFFTYLKDSFDVLYAEGETSPKMMSVGLHCRVVGRPGRAAALMRFLDYIVRMNGFGCRRGCRSRSTGTPIWRILPRMLQASDRTGDVAKDAATDRVERVQQS